MEETIDKKIERLLDDEKIKEIIATEMLGDEQEEKIDKSKDKKSPERC